MKMERGRKIKERERERERERESVCVRWTVGCRIYVLMQIICMRIICNPKSDFFARKRCKIIVFRLDKR